MSGGGNLFAGYRFSVQDRGELHKGLFDVLAGNEQHDADDHQVGKEVSILFRNGPAHHIRKDGQGGNCEAEQREADQKGQHLQTALAGLGLVEGLAQNLEVVPEGKGDVCEIRRQKDQHGPADIDKVLQHDIFLL